MIISRIEDVGQYAKLVPGLNEAVDAALKLWPDIAAGKLDISAKYRLIDYVSNAELEAYFFFQKGVTRSIEVSGNTTEHCDDAEGLYQFEVHRKYVDVQILIEGAEDMVWAPIDSLTVSQPYQAEADIEFLRGDGTIIEIKPNNCYILLPDDGHLACGHVSMPTEYSKLIIKLPIHAE
jgi:YhcH/YjgK/YiaL family protein